MAWRTLPAEPARVVVPGLVIFALDALQGTFFTELAVDHLGLESVTGAFVFGASTLGLTFYSGMLERMVGAVERNEARSHRHGAADAAVGPALGGRARPARGRRAPPSSSCPAWSSTRSSPWSARSSTSWAARCARRSGVPCGWCGPTSCSSSASSPSRWRSSTRSSSWSPTWCPTSDLAWSSSPRSSSGDLFGMALGLTEVSLAERLVRERTGRARAYAREWSADVEAA